jgi:hypothetical protein
LIQNEAEKASNGGAHGAARAHASTSAANGDSSLLGANDAHQTQQQQQQHQQQANGTASAAGGMSNLNADSLNQMGDQARAMMSRMADSALAELRTFSQRKDTNSAAAAAGVVDLAADNPFAADVASAAHDALEVGVEALPDAASSHHAPIVLGMKAEVREFIHIFVNQPDYLVQFLEFMVSKDCTDPQAYNTLLELYLKGSTRNFQKKKPFLLILFVESPNLSEEAKTERQNRAFDILTDPKVPLDVDQAMMLCRMYRFRRGLLRLYEKQGMYRDIVQFYMEADDYDNVIRTVKKHGDKEPNLWLNTLTYFAQRPHCQQEIRDVLACIDRENILPPLLVIQTLARHKTVPLSNT